MKERVAHLAPFGLRLMPSLRAKVQASADANGRSLNREINFQLGRLYGGEEAAGTSPGKANPAADRHSALQGAATTHG